MTYRARWTEMAHDLSLCWMTGGIAGAGMSAVLLFRLAPTREVAGQIGNVIFGVLGRAVFILTVVLLVARLVMRRSGAPRPALWPAVLACLLAAALALWITPVMTAIWHAAPHDPAGGGLMAADKARFMRLHGVGNLIYLALFGLGSLLIASRAMERSGGTGASGQAERP